MIITVRKTDIEAVIFKDQDLSQGFDRVAATVNLRKTGLNEEGVSFFTNAAEAAAKSAANGPIDKLSDNSPERQLLMMAKAQFAYATRGQSISIRRGDNNVSAQMAAESPKHDQFS